MQHTEDYVVRLDAFEGPLDLLLYLIRRAEVDIVDIPIGTIADQYLRHLAGIERVDIELAGEFLVMAATLMEIKSRMISPAPSGGAGGSGGSGRSSMGTGSDPGAEAAGSVDPREELIVQLLAYKRVRDAAQALDERREQWERRYPAAPAAGPSPSHAAAETDEHASLAAVEVEDLELFDLVEAFARILETVDIERAVSGSHAVAYDDTPFELHAEDILDRLRRLHASAPAAGTARLTLREMFMGRTRPEMIGLFLALLELIRRRSVVVAVEPADRECLITLNADPAADEGVQPASAEG